MPFTGLVRDTRFAFRSLRRTPGFTAVIVLTLALGIGGTTALFSVADAALFRPLPFRDPERLVMIYNFRVPIEGLPMRAGRPSLVASPRPVRVYSECLTI
jgi:hypothetical protein